MIIPVKQRFHFHRPPPKDIILFLYLKTYIKLQRSVKIYCWNRALFQTAVLSLTDVRWKSSWSKSSKSVFSRAEFSSHSPSVCIHLCLLCVDNFADRPVHAILLALARETEYVSVGVGVCVNSVLPQSQRLPQAPVSRSCLLGHWHRT